jgi:quercetin dioxygenase-like cupin family protein
MSYLDPQRDVLTDVVAATGDDALEVFGATIEFLSWSEDALSNFSVIRSVVPPGVTVPLHSHDDVEDIFIVSGTEQILIDGPGGLRWRDASAGDYVRVPRGLPHAHRNVSGKSAVSITVTTTRIARFLRAVGRPISESPRPPTPAERAHVVDAAKRHGYRLGSAEDNAAVGIDLAGLVSPPKAPHRAPRSKAIERKQCATSETALTPTPRAENNAC